MARYDTYGFRATTLEGAAALVESALGFRLEERDSSYYAGTYYSYRTGSYGRRLKLYNNYDEVSRGWVREEYRDYSVILQVDDLEDMDGIQKRLTEGREDPVLLRSKVLLDDPE